MHGADYGPGIGYGVNWNVGGVVGEEELVEDGQGGFGWGGGGVEVVDEGTEGVAAVVAHCAWGLK